MIKSTDICLEPNIYVSHQVKYQTASSAKSINTFVEVVKAAQKTIVKQFRKHLDVEQRKVPVHFVLKNIKQQGTGGRCYNHWGTIIVEVNHKYHLNDVRKLAITVAHELVHAEQYLSGRLAWDFRTARFIWEGSVNSNKGSTYQRYRNQPWEIEAFSSQDQLADIIIDNMPKKHSTIDMHTSNGLVR